MKHLIRLVMLIAFTASSCVFAGNAAPLGLEIGVATLAQVQKEVGSISKLADGGINLYSGGKMLTGSGKGLGVDGLNEISFIFDQGDLLAAVVMKLPKAEGMNDLKNGFYKKTVNALAAKYKLIERREPFVGDAYAMFSQGNSIIELEAPHMGFGMVLRYITKDLRARYNKQSSDDQATKRRNQASKF